MVDKKLSYYYYISVLLYINMCRFQWENLFKCVLILILKNAFSFFTEQWTRLMNPIMATWNLCVLTMFWSFSFLYIFITLFKSDDK